MKVAKSMELPLPIDPGQVRALLLNESSPWQSDLPDLLGERDLEFRLSYALDQLTSR